MGILRLQYILMRTSSKTPLFPVDFFQNEAPRRPPLRLLPIRPLIPLPPLHPLSHPSALRLEVPTRPFHKGNKLEIARAMGRSQSTKLILPDPTPKSMGRDSSLPLLKPQLHFPQNKRANLRLETRFFHEDQSFQVTFGRGKMAKHASQAHLQMKEM